MTDALSSQQPPTRRDQRQTGLPWGLNFNAHTHPIPSEKPVGIPTESPYPQNPEILHTRTLHPVYFCLMHYIILFLVMYAICM